MLYCPFVMVGECVSIDIIFVLAIMVKIMMIALMENTKAEKYLHTFSEFFAPNPLRSDNEDKEEDDLRDN